MARGAGEGSATKVGIESVGADVFVAALLRYASDAIAVSERESGRFVVVSDSYCALTGYDRDELVGRTSVELGLVADHDVRSDALGPAGPPSGAVHELRLRRKDGTIRLFEFSVQDMAGGLMLTISRDATARRAIEAELQASEERFRLLAENSRDMIRLFDADAVTTYASPSCASVLGYAPDELVGRRSTEFQHPDDAKRQDGRRHSVVAALGDDVTLTYRSRRKGGGYVWLESSVRALRDERGEILGFHETARDISDRKQAEETLRESERRFRVLAENSTDVIMRVSSDTIVLYVSPACRALFGYEPDELIGRSAREHLHPDDSSATLEARAAIRVPGSGDHTVEYRTRRKDGSYVWVESKTRTLWDPVTEEPIEFQIATRDISERKHAEAAIRRSQAEAERANRAKSEFLSSMSHELRTPLNGILGFTGTLLMGLPGPVNDEQTAQLRTVQRSGRHLLSLINDLLDLARIESGKMELHPEPLDCQGLLDEVVVGLRPLAAEKGLTLEVSSLPEPVELICDRRAINQILINLTNNAIKFTNQGGVRLEVNRRSAGDRRVTRFAVIDTGHGIAPEDQRRLFAAFEQIGTANSSPFEGTGLGLHISRSLADLIGAEITFESQLGEGSTFALEVVR